MKQLQLAEPGKTLKVLLLGAHSDDIEIGVGGTLLGWIEKGVKLDAHWVVLSGSSVRAEEARGSAAEFLAGAYRSTVEIADFRDSFFPYQGAEIKDWLNHLRKRVEPDIIFTHNCDDKHQDHCTLANLTTKAFRDHLTLEYEIPKWDGDLGRPNTYIPMTAAMMEKKLTLLDKHFASQRSKDWFDRDTFQGLARLRGMECRAPERFAEAFIVRKLALS